MEGIVEIRELLGDGSDEELRVREALEDPQISRVSGLRNWVGAGPMSEAGNQEEGQILGGDNGVSFALETRR